ncbi:hypothetical protein HCJ17_05335 [Listeria booriae]|nr:hypothetical protein [Listeria booriae]
MFINLNKENNVVEYIEKNITLFDSFKHVYLFGSILKINTAPDDIDILLIYSGDSSEIIYELNFIRPILETISRMSIDLTVLSVQEEKDTKFLKRISPQYLKLK